MAIYKLTSIDIGSTMSQMAQAYVDSSDGCKTWIIKKTKARDTDYLISDDGIKNIPTIILKTGDLTPDQLAFADTKEEYLCGKAAERVYESIYNCPVISEFKKDFFCSDKAFEEYKKACEAIEIFLKYLKKLSDLQEQQYQDDVVEEKTIITMPVRCNADEIKKMKEMALSAGWKNIEIKDEARSIIRYETCSNNSTVLAKLKDFTALQHLNVLILDLGGSTADILVSKVSPDGKGGFVCDNVGQWPEVGETDTLGGIDIDKNLCNWMLEHEFIIEEETEKLVSIRGYNDFRKFKERNMGVLRTGKSIQDLGMDKYEFNLRERLSSNVNYSESALKLDGKVFLEEIAGDYYLKLQSAIRKVLKKSSVKEDEVDLVIVSGGGSNIYGIKELLLGELSVENPLDFKKIKEDKSLLKADFSYPSALCAISNVLPAGKVSFVNHALYNYNVGVDVYELPLVKEHEFLEEYKRSSGTERLALLNSLKCVYYKKTKDIIKFGEPLPYKKEVTEDFDLPYKNKVNYIYTVKIYAEKDGKDYYQYGFFDCSYRTLRTMWNDMLRTQIGTKHMNYKINFDFNSDYIISVRADFKIEGQIYWFANKGQINGTQM